MFTVTREFKSLHELYNYLKDRPNGEMMRGQTSSSNSSKGNIKWTKTNSYSEAIDLMLHGWDAGSKKLTDKLNKIKAPTRAMRRSVYDVVGGNVSVPRHLQGLPTSMIRTVKKNVPTKTITLNKDISYHSGYSEEEIIEQSLKALQIIRILENAGFRINLNIIHGVYKNYGGRAEEMLTKIQIKKAGERLNLSKVAFPLVHPSMLRRVWFKVLEVETQLTNTAFRDGYGTPMDPENIIEHMGKNEYYLPRDFGDESPEEFVEKMFKK